MPIRDDSSCPGCGLPNYAGLCPVCRGDYPAYEQELQPFFGSWHAGAPGTEATPPKRAFGGDSGESPGVEVDG
jgi:hypothetical protein